MTGASCSKYTSTCVRSSFSVAMRRIYNSLQYSFAFCLCKSSHTRMGKSYRPLKWSAYLKDSAQKYANHLAATGTWGHSGSGENLAKHSDSTGSDRSPSDILTWWVEDEMKPTATTIGHMTQVLWRATEYVGCGEARRGNTFYKVCHYSKPGNCGSMSLAAALADDSSCAGKILLY